MRFVARLYSIWLNRYVDLPASASADFRGRHVPIKGTCNGTSFRGTLVPRGGGHFRLGLNAAVRKAAGGVDSGDEVVITLSRTTPHPVGTVPPDLVAALAARRGARLAFEAWAPGKRRHILLWLNAAKHPETRAKRVVIILERLGFEPSIRSLKLS